MSGFRTLVLPLRCRRQIAGPALHGPRIDDSRAGLSLLSTSQASKVQRTHYSASSPSILSDFPCGDSTQEPSKRSAPVMMRFCVPHTRIKSWSMTSSSRMFRLHLHESNNVTQSRGHAVMTIGRCNRARADRDFVEEDIAQKMVSVQNHARRSRVVNKITHFLPEASSCCRNESLGVRSKPAIPAIRSQLAGDDAPGSTGSPRPARRYRRGRRKFCAPVASSLPTSVLRLPRARQSAGNPAHEQRDTFRPQPPVEKTCSRFCDRNSITW